MATKPRLKEVKITKNAGSITVWPIWADVDSPRGTGFQLRDDARGWALADRLKQAMLDGKSWTSPPKIKRNVQGKTYVEANLPVLGRRMNADLTKLGYPPKAGGGKQGPVHKMATVKKTEPTDEPTESENENVTAFAKLTADQQETALAMVGYEVADWAVSFQNEITDGLYDASLDDFATTINARMIVIGKMPGVGAASGEVQTGTFTFQGETREFGKVYQLSLVNGGGRAGLVFRPTSLQRGALHGIGIIDPPTRRRSARSLVGNEVTLPAKLVSENGTASLTEVTVGKCPGIGIEGESGSKSCEWSYDPSTLQYVPETVIIPVGSGEIRCLHCAPEHKKWQAKHDAELAQQRQVDQIRDLRERRQKPGQPGQKPGTGGGKPDRVAKPKPEPGSKQAAALPAPALRRNRVRRGG